MRDGHKSECRQCHANYVRHRSSQMTADQRAAKYKTEYARNREKKLAAAKAYNKAHPDRVRESNRRCKRLNWSAGLISNIRQRARRLGVPFDLTTEILMDLFTVQNGRCYWLDIPLVASTGTRDPLRPSVDRLDNSLGYTKDNVVLTCMFANMGRSTLDVSRMREFVRHLRESWSDANRGHST